MTTSNTQSAKGRSLVHLRCVTVSLLLTLVLTQCFVGPRDVSDPAKLTAVFSGLFGFAPSPDVADMQYRISESSDDYSEWFRFRADQTTVDRIKMSYSAGPTLLGFPSASPNAPEWWKPSAAPIAERSFGYQIGGTVDRFSSKQIFLSFDPTTRTVHFYCSNLR